MSGRWRLVLAAAAALSLSGCGFSGLYGVPLPGGAKLGSHPLTITADFTDALDLVPQSGVRVNEVPVGRVDSITLSADGRTAAVKMSVNDSVHLPANAVAAIEQTSLLGEKYVALSAPSGQPATGVLASGAVIGVARTNAGIQAEQVLGALSLLLNGGGLAQLQTIDRELNTATGGNTASFRQLFSSLDSVVGQLNTHRGEITTALDQLNRLSATLAGNDAKIANVLANYSPGLKVLADERTQLVGMLNALNELSTVSVSTINASQVDFVHNLKLLNPVLDRLAAAGQALPDSLQVLFTYPFPDQALAAIKGDYVNAFITLNLHTTESQLTTTLQPGLTRATTSSPPATSSSAATSSSQAPPTLLPATSSVYGTLPVSPTASATGSGSASASGSASSSASATDTASGTPTTSSAGGS